MKTLIDTNVWLDVLQAREPFFSDSLKVLQMVASGKIEGYVSVQSLTDIFKIVKRSSKETDPFKSLEKITFICDMIDVSPEDVFSALLSDDEDFDRAVRVYSALRNDIKMIITRTKMNLDELDITVIEPSEIGKYVDKGVETGESIIG